MLNIPQLATGSLDFTAQQAFKRIGESAAQAAPRDQRDFLRRFQRLRHAIGISANQPTGSEFDSTEVTHHGSQYAFKILQAQDFQHGPTCRPARLAIIHSGRMSARQQGPAHMRRAGMLLAQTGDNFLCRRPIRHRLDTADEATRDVTNWLKCYYMRDRIGEEFAGTIASVVPFGVFVALDSVYVEGLVHVSELGEDYFQYDSVKREMLGERTGKRYRLGDRLQVRLVRADLESGRIDFVLSDDGVL